MVRPQLMADAEDDEDDEDDVGRRREKDDAPDGAMKGIGGTSGM